MQQIEHATADDNPVPSRVRKPLAVLAGGLVLGALYLSSLYSYQLFHTLAELFSVVIGCGIFMMAWNARRFLNNNYLLLLGIACFFVAILDLAHLLAYKGMAIFPGEDANPATQLWIAARFMGSLSLLAAPFLLGHRASAVSLLSAYAALTLVLLVSIFVWPVFPVCYVEGVGLTHFKRISEYSICVVLLASAGALIRRRDAFDTKVLNWLLWSIGLTAGSELLFTFYVSVYGLSNLAGHMLKIGAFYLIYKAIIQTGLTQPYSLLLREAKQSEERYRLLFDRSPDGVFAVDTNGRFLIANPACATISGYPLAELLEKTFPELCAPDQAKRTLEHFTNAVARTEYSQLETALVRKDGGRVELWLAGEPILFDGKVVAIHCTARDVTDRKRAEEALRTSEERLRMALEAASEGVWEWNIATGKVVWSRENYELYGIEPSDGALTHAAWEQRLHPEDVGPTNKVLRETLEGLRPEYRAEFRVLHPRKGMRWILGLGRVERGPDGAALRMIGINLDITQKKAFEAELERLVAERTAQLEEMVSELQHVSYSMVHDMRAPLRAIEGFASLLKAACERGEAEQVREFHKRIGAATKRIDMQITDALQYTEAVLQEVKCVPVDLGLLLSELLESYPNLHPERAQIAIEGPLPVVMGNESLLTQCFSNLLDNAVKFVRPSQRARVRVWAELKKGVEGDGTSEVASNDMVRVWVEDNGIGIPKDVHEEVFRMFHRETTGYEGTGIGLAIVRKVVERMGGKVGLESEPGEGSRFWVELRVGCIAAT